MKLNFKELGSGKPMVILHGLFGSLDNWMTLGRRFAENYHVFLVDQRNHGHSDHDDVMTYEAMAEDLLEFFDEHELKDVVLVGHSMGGKTAMQFSIDNHERLDKMVVVDIGPQGYEVHHDHLIRSMQSLDLENITSRREAEEELAHLIEANDTRQFLLKNLYRKKQADGTGIYAWRFNLDVIANDIEEVGLPIYGICETPTLFIRGSKSDYLEDDQLPEIRSSFPKAELISLNTGHWVHAEDSDGLFKIISEFAAGK